MKKIFDLGKNLCQRFRKDRSGQVALTFAFAIVPMLGLAGLGMDYGNSLSVKAELDAAADQAALEGVSTSGNPNMALPTQATVAPYFYAAAANIPNATITSVTVNASTSVTSLFVTVSYTATVPTSFSQIMGFHSFTVSGTASSEAQIPKYVNFYLMLDNSPSMGLAATTSDISNMQALTPDQCAFACHQHSFNSSNKITGDNTSDYYHLAKNNGVTTRIDVLRTATQSLTTTAASSETLPNQFKMGVYTFSDTFQTIAAPTTNLTSGATSVQQLANNIDLAYAYYDQRDTQTSYDTALKYMSGIIPTPGDGSTTAKPMEFLFIVTDGVVDEPVGSASGTGDAADTWNTGASGWPANTKANVKSTLTGNVSSTRLITTINTATCTSIKNTGVKIAVLYTTYLPVTVNSFYNSWVAPIANSIPTQLQSCASPGFYFQVSPTGGIAAAMEAMFVAALTEARLTK